MSMSKVTSSKADVSVDLMSDVQLGGPTGMTQKEEVIFEDVYEDML